MSDWIRISKMAADIVGVDVPLGQARDLFRDLETLVKRGTLFSLICSRG
jgi:hypothetical protein